MAKHWNTKLKTTLAVIWFVFTFSLVTWWLVYSLRRDDLNTTAHRMFAWEGSILLAAVLIGGGVMVFLSYRDEQRHQRLRFFFSNFSHDIKTSISRLRLQAEVLEEDAEQMKNPVFRRLIQDINRLDLQLENSLLLSSFAQSPLFLEELSLSQMISSLRSDFSDLKVELNQDAIVRVDKRAFLSVLRNLFQNSVLHGKADAVQIHVSGQAPEILIRVRDNGLGFKGEIHRLGQGILRSNDQRGNGIGLFISRSLVRKMRGQLNFFTDNQGFEAQLKIPGRIR